MGLSITWQFRTKFRPSDAFCAMKSTSILQSELKDSLKKALRIVDTASRSNQIPMQVWKRLPPSGWAGQYEIRPELSACHAALMDHLTDFVSLQACLQAEEPDMLSALVWVGRYSTKCRLYDVLSSMVAVVWHRHGTFAVGTEIIDEIANELLEGWQSRSVTFEFLAPMPNFTLRGAEKIDFPNGVTIRRMTEQEATRLYGGLFPAFKSSVGPTGEFLFAGQFIQPLASHDNAPTADRLRNVPLESIRSVERAMMTFKAGPVIHEWIAVTLAKPSPIGTQSIGLDKVSGKTTGTYEIDQSEIPDLIEEFTLLETVQFPALSLACARLVDSERRTSAIDSLMDAVIGLESLLLDGSDREGLRFRFALNYATFESDMDSATKQARFKQALAVYKIRSQVVHAGTTSEKHYDFAGERMTLTDVSVRAMQMLRSTVNGFLRLKGLPPTTKERERWLADFWQRGYFGMR